MKIKKNTDGTYTVSGAGYFWVQFDRKGNAQKIAEGMREKPSYREFLKKARKKLLDS